VAQDYDLADGGFNENLDLVLKVRTNLFTDGIYPQPQQTLTFKGRDFRIEKVDNTDTFGVMLKLALKDTTRITQ